MIAACYRRSGDYHRALSIYRKIHSMFPENMTCLRSLARLCNDLGLEEGKLYESKLARVLKRSSPNQKQFRAPGDDTKQSKLLLEGSQILSSRSSLGSPNDTVQQNMLKSPRDDIASKKETIIEEDLLNISARPSTTEMRNEDFHNDYIGF